MSLQNQKIQTNILNTINETKLEADLYNQKHQYMSQSFASLYIINNMLFYSYYILFAIVVVYVLYKYLFSNTSGAVSPNSSKMIMDIVFLLVFATLPFWAIYLEEIIYMGIKFILSLIKNNVYTNDFYKTFNSSDFYANPKLYNCCIHHTISCHVNRPKSLYNHYFSIKLCKLHNNLFIIQ